MTCGTACAIPKSFPLAWRSTRQLQYRSDHGVDRHSGRIDDRCIASRLERCDGTPRITHVARLNLAPKGGKCNAQSLFFQLLITPFRAFFGARGKENLGTGIRKDHRAHVAAVRNQAWRLAEGP